MGFDKRRRHPAGISGPWRECLLYAEMGKTVRDFGFDHAEMTQVAETAVDMRNDLINLAGTPYKNHRVFRKKI